MDRCEVFVNVIVRGARGGGKIFVLMAFNRGIRQSGFLS
jgi:hypothetical protein